MKVVPFPYQKEGIDLVVNKFNGRAMICDSAGLGKTLQALHIIRRLPQAMPAVVICPAIVKWHWESEALKHIGIRGSVLEGQTPPKLNGSLHAPKLLILNYEISQYWVDWLKHHKPQMVIVDECQRISNPANQCTKAIKELCQDVPYLLGLSATPLQNRPIELFTIANLLWPAQFDSRWSYGSEFCSPKMVRGKWQFKGATNCDVLHARLTKAGMIRRRKADVMKQLPKKIRQVTPMPIRRPEEYAEAETNFLTWLHKQDPGKAARARRSEAVVQVGYLLRLAAKLKVRSVVEWINEFLDESDEKLAVFGVHRKMIEAIAKHANAKSVILNGDTPPKHRRNVVHQFTHDKATRLFIGNIVASGTGTDGLQGSCSNMAIIELDWRPGMMEQIEGRLNRIGQQYTTWINYLIARGTWEEKLCKILQRKQANLSAILDGKSNVEDLDVFDLLMKEVNAK